ncbi:MAG: hypothetical protein DID92_2727745379 [Candidatus Nitrotoga sp. SPKER]|nr:MAG: hypothetical protein DID92_2727745379 [Candidatus Nitrotoga sp. SPKER]
MDVQIVDFPETKVAVLEHLVPQRWSTNLSGNSARFPDLFSLRKCRPQGQGDKMITDVYLPLL